MTFVCQRYQKICSSELDTAPEKTLLGRNTWHRRCENAKGYNVLRSFSLYRRNMDCTDSQDRLFMKTVYVTTERRYFEYGEGIFLSGSENEKFFERYLTTFDKVVVIGRCQRVAGVPDARQFLESEKVHLARLGLGFLRQAKVSQLLRLLQSVKIEKAALLVRTPGMLAYAITCLAVIMRVPYSLEVVADPYEEAKFVTGSSALNGLLARVLLMVFRLQIKACRAASFVTRFDIQERYLNAGDKRREKFSFSYSSLRLPDNFFVEGNSAVERSTNRSLTFLFVGELHRPFKGLDTLIKAASSLTNLSMQVIVVGDGTLLSSYKRLAQDLGVAPVFKFLGYISNDEAKLQIYRSSDVFVLPSRREGLPRVVIEAMANALPCLVSDVCGARELVDNEFVFPIDSHEVLAEKMAWLASDREAMLRASRRNRAESERYRDGVLHVERQRFYEYVLGSL